MNGVVTASPKVLVGYLTIRVGADPDRERLARLALAAYASRHGYLLDEVFVERDVNRPMIALAALIDMAGHCGVDAVAVPTLEDLGWMASVRHMIRGRLRREAGIRRFIVLYPLETEMHVFELVLDAVGVTSPRSRDHETATRGVDCG